ncbi:MAG: HEPN domain-containing protein [Treponema sp.]|jgi:HEPN domain-containing protein|nr:HEPN domain-containing protein [Treponema sp.]
MKIKDVIEWMQIADDDFDSAKILNESARKYYEIICYHCAQAAEKYLKGYLSYNDIIPQKTHNLLLLNEVCIETDNAFLNIRTECGLLNRFTNEIRYPHRIEINGEDVNYSLIAAEKIRNFEPMQNLRNIITPKNNAKETDVKENGK